MIVFLTWLFFLLQQFFIGLRLPLDLLCSFVIFLNLYQLPGRLLAAVAGGVMADIFWGTPGFFLFGFLLVFLTVKVVFSLVSLNSYFAKFLTILGSLFINLLGLFLITRLSFELTDKTYYLSLFMPADFSILVYLGLNALFIFALTPPFNKIIRSKYVEIS